VYIAKYLVSGLQSGNSKKEWRELGGSELLQNTGRFHLADS
jgi:hypothetical protein